MDKYEAEWKYEINENRKSANLNQESSVVTTKYIQKGTASENQNVQQPNKNQGVRERAGSARNGV
jgi:hypothetical protein